MLPKRNETAGFSLTEALVALAIAAFLAAVLTRFASSTRLNAFKVREEIAMDVLSDSLLERVVVRGLQPGRTDGRSGALAWHLDVAPVVFYASARSVSEKKPATAGGGQATAVGLTPASSNAGTGPPTAGGGQLSSLGSTSASNNTDKESQGVVQSQPRVTWNTYHITAVINAPSGRSHAIDTIRIARQQVEQPGQADQR